MPSGLTLYLPYPPTANNLFPTGKGGKRFVSPQYKQWKSEAWAMLIQQPRHLTPGKVSVEYRVARPDKRRRDLANTEKACTDLLVEHGLIEDDSLIQRLLLEWDETRPPWGVQVTIRPWVQP